MLIAGLLLLGVVSPAIMQEQQPVSNPVAVPMLPAANPPYQLNMEELALSQVYQDVVDSTVNITVAGNDAPLGTGSGFVIDTDGHIVTNNHVVEGAASIQVTFVDGRIVEADLVGHDPGSDLAVIKVNPADVGTELDPVEFADSDQVQVGQRVMAIGSPFGENFTLTTGIVSAVGRTIEGSERFVIPRVIQTDAAVNPGNSGGPLLNWGGQVIGVNAAILSASRSGSGVGFAIPSNTVRRVVPYLIQDGEFRHSYLGISGGPLQPAQREAMGLPVDVNGVMVAGVVPGGPAEAAGLRGTEEAVSSPFGDLPINGDIITAINGEPVTQVADLTGYLEANTLPGDTVTLTIWRDGQTQDVLITLQERPMQADTQQ
ncbi:MAG: trypsin-like peptidase domain-containing protein [Chloroflexi bacterium]|nr:trypsin-like peptidase domain-containing protein [Chloroflexota bacterium]